MLQYQKKHISNHKTSSQSTILEEIVKNARKGMPQIADIYKKGANLGLGYPNPSQADTHANTGDQRSLESYDHFHIVNSTPH